MNKKIEIAIRKEISFLPKGSQDKFLKGFQRGAEEWGVINKLFDFGVGMAPQRFVDRVVKGVFNDKLRAQLLTLSAFSSR